MTYSLRSLLLVVTVAAVLIALWGENWRTCRRRELEHAQQAAQLDEKIRAEVQLWIITYTGSSLLHPKLIQEHERLAHEHRCLAAEYRQAVWQPWKRWRIEQPHSPNSQAPAQHPPTDSN